MSPQHAQIAVPPMTPVVRAILVLSGVIFLGQLIFDTATGGSLASIFGFVPARLAQGWIWQPFTYAFLHAGIFHILFNLLVVWTVGAELEALWGKATFVGFFFVCALGAALFHGIFSLVGIGARADSPVVGSSGVVFGLLLAYGILFGERVMYFFMLFPMKAKYFVLLLGGVEIISSVFYGRDGVSHLAHLGGMVFGFLFLASMAAWRARLKGGAKWEEKKRAKRLKKAGHLRLVRGEEGEDDPIRWN